MHPDREFASCNALVMRIRQGPAYQATDLPLADSRDIGNDRGDTLIEIRSGDLPKSATRKRRGKSIGQQPGLPAYDSQQPCQVAEMEEEWFAEAAAQAEEAAAKDEAAEMAVRAAEVKPDVKQEVKLEAKLEPEVKVRRLV